MKKSSAKTVADCAMLCAVSAVLSMLESAIPAPVFLVPGCRLGLSNLAVIIAIFITGSMGAASVAVVKSLFVFVTRGAVAGVMSICGGLFSLAVMLLLFRSGRFGFLGVSVASAAAHNAAQLAAASLLIGDFSVLSVLWLYLLLSVVTGALTGTAAGIIIPPLGRTLKMSIYAKER